MDVPRELRDRAVIIPNGILHLSGPTLEIEVKGKVYYFDWHHFCGPSFYTRSGKETRFPGEKNPVWDAIHWWRKQGCRMDGNRCVFDWETELVHITKSFGNVVIVLFSRRKVASGDESRG